MNLGAFFSDIVDRTPDRTAVIDAGRTPADTLTYAELDDRMSRIAQVLLRDGIGSGDRVLVLTVNSALFVEAFFAAMRIGAVPVPLNTTMAGETLEHVLNDSKAKAAIVWSGLRPGLLETLRRRSLQLYGEEPVADGVRNIRCLMAEISETDAARTRSGGAGITDMADLDTAIHTYTSGSTGKPKGVILTHGGMLWSLRHAQSLSPVPAEARGLIALPMFHKNAMRGIVKPMLFAGASITILPAFDPATFIAAVEEHRCTYTSGVPAAFNILHASRHLAEGRDLSSLKTIAVGSAAVSGELVDRLTAMFPEAGVKESYGLTEGGSPFWPHPDGRPTPKGSCGYLAPGYEVRLCVPSTGAVIDTDNETGELWMKSPYVAREYHNLPELTAERIVDGWLKTGDLFSRDSDGFYYFRGRTDDMFNCGGENIYPREVEDLLLRHPDVAEAVVMPMRHKTKGAAPAALVRRASGSGVGADDLKSFCLGIAPAYLHPRHIVFCETPPLNPAGKYDRTAIRRLLEADGAVEML